jgi:multidrug efflux pump subunit AcrB
MIRFLLLRPIGTTVLALTLTFLGIVAFRLVPVSLLPDIPVPQITVHADYNDADINSIEQLVAHPLRNHLLQINKLDDLEIQSSNGHVTAKLTFNYGIDLDLAYLEVNEKVDMLMQVLPRDMPRPRVIKASASDIPVFQLNVRYHRDSNDFQALSLVCENVIKRQLEQLPEVALVDITGLTGNEIIISPNNELLYGLGIPPGEITSLIQNYSNNISNITFRDGHYEYAMGIDVSPKRIEDLYNLTFDIKNTVNSRGNKLISLRDIADIKVKEKKLSGKYIFNGSRAIGMSIIKQSDSQMLRLRAKIETLISSYKRTYPQLDFVISQDQTEILDQSISNLSNSLLLGAILSLLMIFLFMSDRRIPALIALVIPISLSTTMLGFYVLDLSINIISLAGLVLGIGEIIDSAIIIVENIEQKRELNGTGDKHVLYEACVSGSEEVIRPLFTSVLTNCAVFVPLIFLSGIAGSLFYDQAIAVTLSLGTSLVTSYILIPVLYYQIYKHNTEFIVEKTNAGKYSELIYHTVFDFSFKYPRVIVASLAILILSAAWAYKRIEKAGMPKISHFELETAIHWNEPILIEEIESRLGSLYRSLHIKIDKYGQYIGQQQYLLSLNGSFSEANTTILINRVSSATKYTQINEKLSDEVKRRYPNATIVSTSSKNVFEQLFQTTDPPIKIHLYAIGATKTLSPGQIDSVVTVLKRRGIHVMNPAIQSRVKIELLHEKIKLYEVDVNRLIEVLQLALKRNEIESFSSDTQQIPIVLSNSENVKSLFATINLETIENRNGLAYPVKEFITLNKESNFEKLYIGKSGSYVKLEPAISKESVTDVVETIRSSLRSFRDIDYTISGAYFRNETYLKEMSQIMAIACMMMFFILAAQFESLLQPLIVFLMIILGISGSVIMLYLFGDSINIMSLIGMVVLMGLIDNDSVLKIDTMNRLRDEENIISAIRSGGLKRLQSQLMTFFTTILGLLPILWSSGLGAELQRSLSLAVLGGMFVGLFSSWTVIPLTYWILSRR